MDTSQVKEEALSDEEMTASSSAEEEKLFMESPVKIEYPVLKSELEMKDPLCIEGDSEYILPDEGYKETDSERMLHHDFTTLETESSSTRLPFEDLGSSQSHVQEGLPLIKVAFLERPEQRNALIGSAGNHLMVDSSEEILVSQRLKCPADINRPKEITTNPHTQETCDRCAHEFTSQSRSVNQDRTEGKTCEPCSENSSQECNLVMHRRTHADKKTPSSSHDTMTFSSSIFLLKHQRNNRNESEKCSPPVGRRPCGKAHKCDDCLKTFLNKSDLARHQRVHTGEKPFKCKYCSKQFTCNSALVTHIRVHTGEKPYKCRYCTKSFSQSSSLKDHVRIHTGEKPYKCEHCTKRFSQNSTLVAHTRVHTGERPFKCKHCTKQFRQTATLVAHMRSHRDLATL